MDNNSYKHFKIGGVVQVRRINKRMPFNVKGAVLVLVGALLMLLLIGAGCSRARVTEDFYQSYRVKAGTVLEIYNPNGQVLVTGLDDPEQEEIEIAAVKESYYGQSALDAVDIFIDIDDTMVIETVHPPGGTNVTVNYNILVPEGMLVSVIECSNGNIELRGVRGDPVIATSNGNITVSNVRGQVSASSSNGDLLISGAEGLGALRTSNGNIEAELQDIRENIEIRTSNGSISLLVNSDLALDFEAATSNGEISFSNLNIQTTLLEQTALIGIMNGGGRKVSLATSNGSIDLTRLQ